MKVFSVILACLFLAGNLCAQENIIIPRDETSKDPSLSAFVARLKKAITTRDGTWIRSVLDKDVMSSLGDEPGIESFWLYWSPDNDSTDFWPYLDRVVRMGGVFLHDTADHTGKYQFVFPYAYDIDLKAEDDYFLIGAITGKNVNLRAAPSTEAEILGQLTYDIIVFMFEDDEVSSNVNMNEFGDPEWYLVTTYDKTMRGWVNWKYVYSITGPRLFLFKDKKGAWKISAFVAGD